MRIQDVGEDEADALGLTKAAGALVTDVPEGPAKLAGIVAGDVILTFDGNEVEDTRQLVRVVGATAVGKAVDVEIFRDGAMETLSVTLGRREEAEGAIPATAPSTEVEPAEKDILGLTITAMTDELREQLGLDEGIAGLVVRDVVEDSQAFEKGLRAGDVITEAGQQKVNSVSDLEDRIAEAKDAGRKSLLLLIRRADGPRFVALTLDQG